ncbi:MAG: DUF234 domain-containing protein [Thermodesulfobacteriota bacterium]
MGYRTEELTMYTGPFLERLFQQLLIMGTGMYNRIDNYWERGNKNEIDLVAVNDLEKNILWNIMVLVWKIVTSY